ncbi:MAG: class I SAM-dependent methyltransferase [Desulfobulbaceae bacterium]|jgi:SAM-dependent methyltransferase|nr:class I SAM-dependent methyltransferase [Desulfobulbaceae bacterium]
MPDDYEDEPPELFQPLSPGDYARFYALEMGAYADDVAFYRHFLGRREAILELGCGDGRLARRLTALGHTVIGVDNSLAMLRLAGRAPGFVAVAMDMRRLAFAAAPFSVAIIAHNTVNLLADEDEVRQTLRACRAVLRPTGKLLLQLFKPDEPPPERRLQFTIMDLPEGGKVVKEIIREYPPSGETMRFVERYKYRPDQQNGGRFANYQQEMTLLAWKPERWRRLFVATGWARPFLFSG